MSATCPPQNSGTTNRRVGFTLVELLVVITIIAILAALILVAAAGALGAAREKAIAIEINTVGQAIEQYKNDVSGGAYPPDAMVGDPSDNDAETALSDAQRNKVFATFKRHFNKAFPSHREPDELLRGLVGTGTGANENNPNLFGGMTPSEALVFWLQRFSSDPKYPISGSGGPSFAQPSGNAEIEDLSARNWILDVDQTRFGPRDDNNQFNGRSFVYLVNVNGLNQRRQINFWEYYPPNRTQPLVYFDASRGILDVDHPRLANAGVEIHPLKQLKTSANLQDGLQLNDLQLANDGKFQILHCGVDDEWGKFEPLHIPPQTAAAGNVKEELLLYPDGPFTGPLADTIVNFSDRGNLEDSQP